MHKTIIFNGINKNYLYLLRGSERPAWAPVENTIIEVPGMPGGYVSETKKKVRVLNLVVGIKLPSDWTFEQIEEDLAAWLVTDQVGELILTDEPNRIYYAKIEGSLNLNRLRRTAEGVLTFICPDPYKYGEDKAAPIVNGLVTVQNLGTAETPPLVKLNVLQPTTFIDIVTDNAYMRLGKIPSVEDTVYQPRTTILNDSMNSMVGWSPTTFASEIGTITSDGVIQSDGDSMFPQNYGTGSSLLWHGPAVAKSLSEELVDYDIRFRAHHVIGDLNTIGRTELYLLDVNKVPIARLTMTKSNRGKVSTLEVRLIADNPSNSRYLVRVMPEDVPDWEHLTGFATLKKVGNTFTARCVRTSGVGGRVLKEFNATFEDTLGHFQRKVASVAVVFMKYKDYPTLSLNRSDEALVEKINQRTGIPYIVQAGDTVDIEHKNADIRINGETRLIKTLGSSFFKLKPGENIISVEPSDAVEGEIIYREAFK